MRPDDDELDERDRDAQGGMLSARGGFGGAHHSAGLVGGVSGGLELETFDENPYTEAAATGMVARIDAVFEGMDLDGNGARSRSPREVRDEAQAPSPLALLSLSLSGTIEFAELIELIGSEEIATLLLPLLDNIDDDEIITKARGARAAARRVARRALPLVVLLPLPR